MLCGPEQTRNTPFPLHLQSHSLFSTGAFCLSFAPYPENNSISQCVHLHKGLFIPARMLAHHLVLASEGNAHGKIRYSSVEKQDWFPTVTLWLYFALQPSGCTGNCSWGEENQCLSFSKATSTNVFFYRANTALSRILVKAVSSVTIMIIFFLL